MRLRFPGERGRRRRMWPHRVAREGRRHKERNLTKSYRIADTAFKQKRYSGYVLLFPFLPRVGAAPRPRRRRRLLDVLLAEHVERGRVVQLEGSVDRERPVPRVVRQEKV